MINLAAVEAAKSLLAGKGALLAEEIEEFLPSVWPNHKYTEVTPDGVFQESTDTVSAPNYPGDTMIVPDWIDIGGAYDFGQAEEDKLSAFQFWLFARQTEEWAMGYFTFDVPRVFVPFGVRGDRSFSDGKFPRDTWKAGSFDEERWQNARRGVAGNALSLLRELDRWNGENIVLTNRSWIQTKLFTGPTVIAQQNDTTFANLPELLEDVNPDWHDFNAYLRVAETVDGQDPTWLAAKLSFAAAKSRYEGIIKLLQKGAFAGEYFEECYTLWRTGSQTRRRGP